VLSFTSEASAHEFLDKFCELEVLNQLVTPQQGNPWGAAAGDYTETAADSMIVKAGGTPPVSFFLKQRWI